MPRCFAQKNGWMTYHDAFRGCFTFRCYGTVKDTATITAPGASVTGTFKDVKAGWTAGAGVEGTIGGGWTARLEYLYIDLGKTEQTLATPALGQVISETRRFTDNIVRVGFNYRWGGSAY